MAFGIGSAAKCGKVAGTSYCTDGTDDDHIRECPNQVVRSNDVCVSGAIKNEVELGQWS